MKKTHIFGALLLTFCAFQSNAQFRVDAVNGGGFATGTNAIPGSTIIIGNGGTPAGSNVIIGNGAGTNPGNNGNANTFIGQSTAPANTTGWANTFVGAWTASANTLGTANTFLGQYCGIANTVGSGNVFVGQGTATLSNTGGENTFVGTSSAPNNTTGGGNVFVGKNAGGGNISGNTNVAVGANSSFGSGGLVNATTIGANSQVSASNALILGGTGANAVNVGIGITAPNAHLHTVNAQPENVIFSTTNTSNFSSSTVNLVAPGMFPNNTLKISSNANTNTGTLLSPSAAPPAPAIGLTNMATVLTNGSSLAIGVEGYEQNKIGSIHFINYVANNVGAYNRAEIMRINRTNGYVGIHTRLAGTGGGSGDPQALFHVNLTNPLNSNLNTLTQGIRFEGLPLATPAHTHVVAIDANGNLARTVGGVAPPPNAWLLTGNTTSGSEFIGTLTGDDFRIQTNSLQRARFTVDGNFDMGNNSLTSTATTSAAVGNNNTIDNAASSGAIGESNIIKSSNYSVTFGESNIIDNNSLASQATGTGNNLSMNTEYAMAVGDGNTITQSRSVFTAGARNDIVNSHQVMALGDHDRIRNSYASTVCGEDNEMINAHGCFLGGGHSYSDGSYNLLLGNRLRAETIPTTMPPIFPPLGFTSIMLIGEQIHSDLGRSLSVGFTGSRTTVTTQTGMAVKLDPTSLSTYNPTVNFEVEAGVSTTGPMPIGIVRSNIRFHNLPVAPNPMPAVVIDPATGELFQTTNSYSKNGLNAPNTDSLYKENEVLKAKLSDLESRLASYDEKFASLERSISQLCESGCAGLTNTTPDADVLYQCVPNPSDNNTTINYFLGRNYSRASISLYNLEGKAIRTFSLTPNKGNGSIEVSVGDLQPGVYLYQLSVDGKQVGSKKLQKQ